MSFARNNLALQRLGERFFRQCREPEVRAHRAASALANFGFKSDTRIMKLLVSL
jgi:hypothetical protein